MKTSHFSSEGNNMKYQCQGYQLVEQEDGTEIRVPCTEIDEEGNLYVMKRVFYNNKNPTPGQIIKHAICKGCCDRINEHRVDVLGKKAIVFMPFLDAMVPARDRRNARSQKRSNRKSSARNKAIESCGIRISCGYCSREGDVSEMLCEELSALRRRIGGASPTSEQMLQVGICTKCSESSIMRVLAKLVPMISVMRKLGFLNSKKEEGVAS